MINYMDVLALLALVALTAGGQAQPLGQLITHVGVCEPREAISRDDVPGKWQAIPFEIAEANGFMITCPPGKDAPPITVEPGVTGWHKVYLGVWYGDDPASKQLRVKLSSDPGYVNVVAEVHRAVKDGYYPEKEFTPSQICETFWRCANLTGEKIVFARPLPGLAAKMGSNIAYWRLVPMTQEEIAEYQAELPTPQTKRLLAMYNGRFSREGVWTPQDMHDEFQCFRDSDFFAIQYTIGMGTLMLYPTRVAQVPPRFSPIQYDNVIDGLYRLLDAGYDPLRLLVAAAHDAGMKFFPQVRFSGPLLPPWNGPNTFLGSGQFFADNLQWRCRYPDGEPTREFSLAFPGVREYWVRLLREWAEDYQVDGVSLLFSRSFPFAFFEEPVLEAFKEQYGMDMRQLSAYDPRVLQVRSQFVTQFLREIRQMLDEVGRAQGRHIDTCYVVPIHAGYARYSPKDGLDECMAHGLDVATWIKEGLVDHLDLHIHRYGGHDGSGEHDNIQQFAKLTAGTTTRIYANIYPRRMPPRAYRLIADNYYQAGADGLSFWDTDGRRGRASEWAFIKRLGHRDDLAAWADKGNDYFRTVALVSVNHKPISP